MICSAFPEAWTDSLETLSDFLDLTLGDLQQYVDDLSGSSLLSELQEQAAQLPEFANADLTRLESLHFYRTMLYVITRVRRPNLLVETGVLHGFSSAFLLQAMQDNGKGKLVSIDLPSRGLALAHEGTSDLPRGRRAGWAIPDRLRTRHDLRLGRSEVILPALLAAGLVPDIFLHDSLHTYNHMMFEMTLMSAFADLGTLLIVDNTDLNRSFADFCAANRLRHLEIHSYNSADRIWQHGLAYL